METFRKPDFNDVVRSIYLVSSGLEDVDVFLRRAGDHFASPLVGCIATNKIDLTTRIPFFMGLGKDNQARYNEYYADKNVIVEASLPAISAGSVVSSADYFSDTELARTEYYADYLKRLDAHHVAGVMISSMDDWLYSLSIARPKRSGPYAPEETQDLGALRTHLDAAMHIGSHLGALKSAIKSKAHALDHMNIGVCLLGKKLRLLEANISARDVLKDASLFSCQNGYLCIGSTQNRRLARLLHGLNTGKVAHAMRVRAVDAVAGGEYFVSAFPVFDPEVFWWIESYEASYVLFLDRHLSASDHCKHFLVNEYGLSVRELELVELLVGGSSLTEAAHLLGIGHETARTHLKSVFAKMEIHSQSQLAVTVSRLSAVK